MAGLNQLISAVGAELGMQPHHLAKFFLGEISWIWANLIGFGRKLGKLWQNSSKG